MKSSFYLNNYMIVKILSIRKTKSFTAANSYDGVMIIFKPIAFLKKTVGSDASVNPTPRHRLHSKNSSPSLMKIAIILA